MRAKFIIEWLQALDPETDVTAHTNGSEQVYDIIGSIGWNDGRAALFLVPENEIDRSKWYIYQGKNANRPTK